MKLIKNAELYKHLLAWAREENVRPELEGVTWLQDNWLKRWSCGSAACIAGGAVLAEGGEIVKCPEESDTWERDVLEDGGTALYLYCVMPGREQETIDAAAQRILGLTKTEAEFIFYAGNSLETLEKFVPFFEENTEITNWLL